MTFVACYDLAKCPPTYDVVAFLALAELERRGRGAEAIDLHILPGPAGGFRKDSLWPRDLGQRQHLLNTVLVPICRLLPSVSNVTVHSDRPPELVKAWGTGQYLIGLYKIVKALKENCRPLRAHQPANPRNPKLITMTLREAEHWPLRNSQVEEWSKAAELLASKGWLVNIIRDTRMGNCEESFNLEKRSNLYASARLNLGISNGPMWLAIFMDVPVLMLRPVTDKAGGCFDTGFYMKAGIAKGGQLSNSPSHQRLIWQEDTADNIVAAFEHMLDFERAIGDGW